MTNGDRFALAARHDWTRLYARLLDLRGAPGFELSVVGLGGSGSGRGLVPLSLMPESSTVTVVGDVISDAVYRVSRDAQTNIARFAITLNDDTAQSVEPPRAAPGRRLRSTG